MCTLVQSRSLLTKLLYDRRSQGGTIYPRRGTWIRTHESMELSSYWLDGVVIRELLNCYKAIYRIRMAIPNVIAMAIVPMVSKIILGSLARTCI